MVKQQKKNNRKKQSSKGFTANSAKARKINASTEYETCDEQLRVRQKISSQFQVLRRSADKARKSMNIKHIQNFRNAVRRDASATEM